MRIRKNTKLSSMLLATAGYGGERRETYVCHLNQSPWDVIPLTNLLDSSWFLPSPSSSSSPPAQLNGEDSFDGNVSWFDCNGASLHRLNGSVDGLSLTAAEDDYDEGSMDDDSSHKSQLLELNSPVKTSGDGESVSVTMPAPPKRGRPRGKAKKAQASTENPYEFYYYSGFGPRWARKRGGSSDEKVVMGESKSEEQVEDNKTAAFGSGSGGSFDYGEEDKCELMEEEEEESSDDHGKKNITMNKTKRARKPIKERSLKSLM